MARKDRHMPNVFTLTLRLYKFAWRHWPLILLGALSGAAYGALEMYYITLIRPFLDAFTTNRPPDQIVNLQMLNDVAKWGVYLVAPVAISCWFAQYTRGVLTWKIVIDIRQSICEALLPQSLKYFEDRRGGEFISRITNDVNISQKALSFLFGDAYRLPVKLIAAIVVAVSASWQLSLASVILVPILVVPLHVFGRKIRKAGRKGLERLADVTDLMSQMFSGIRIVKAFKMEDAEAEEFRTANERFLYNMKKAARNRAHGRGMVEIFIRLVLALVAFVAGPVLLNKLWGLTPGRLGLFVAALWMGMEPFKRLVKCYNNLQEAAAGCERIFEVIDLEPDLTDRPDSVDLPEVREGVRFQDVCFAYEEAPVLQDIAFDVPRGQTVALVGRSGAGKSTLVDLLMRFYDTVSGSVLIDGVDVRRIRRDSLLDRVAVVSQQTFLFNRTIAENIRYGRRDATDGEVEAAARAANIHDFIMTQPEGYDTKVGDFGVRMSGGQRQRIAIARAILKNADILILDEAMVGLDAESESLVRQALMGLMRDRTTFAISHDLATLRHSHQIIVLRDGRIVQRGAHEDLIEQPGEYRTLYQMDAAAAGEQAGEAEGGDADKG